MSEFFSASVTNMLNRSVEKKKGEKCIKSFETKFFLANMSYNSDRLMLETSLFEYHPAMQ